MKEAERANLHKTIWSIAEDLRGSVTGWDFKQYILCTLFYRFISENIISFINEKQGDGFDYLNYTEEIPADIKEAIVEEKGFFISPSDLFQNIQKTAHNDENINITLQRALNNIENSANNTKFEQDIKGLFEDFDVNSNKLGGTVDQRNQRLRKILDRIADLNLGSYKNNTIDVFGDAYEYLMAMYASNAGKSGGEFFTPQEVSELLARITTVGKTQINRVYDPACGSGGLLLKFAKILGKDNVDQFCGQEINITTYNLARINMFLHDINPSKFDIAHGDTLLDPQHESFVPFDAIVSNPPYSIKWDGGVNDKTLINAPRFAGPGVLAPASKADLAFTMLVHNSLAQNGTAAIVEFPGAMYRGSKEKTIRKYLVEQNAVDAVIQLPKDLFFGTSIATCILVLKKNKTDTKTLFIDASELFTRVANNNKLTEENINQIIKAFTERSEEKHFSALADQTEIAEQDYDLSVSKYVEQKDTRQAINITELNQSLSEIVARQAKLRSEINQIVAEIEGAN